MGGPLQIAAFNVALLQGAAMKIPQNSKDAQAASCSGLKSQLNERSKTPAERCRSGRTGRSRKPLRVQAFPGFESLSLRHHPIDNAKLFIIFRDAVLSDLCPKTR